MHKSNHLANAEDCKSACPLIVYGLLTSHFSSYQSHSQGRFFIKMPELIISKKNLNENPCKNDKQITNEIKINIIEENIQNTNTEKKAEQGLVLLENFVEGSIKEKKEKKIFILDPENSCKEFLAEFSKIMSKQYYMQINQDVSNIIITDEITSKINNKITLIKEKEKDE